MSTLPVDLSTQASQTYHIAPHHILRHHNFSLKKAPTIINAKKLPKDFFARQKIQESRTAKKVFKTPSKQIGGSQKIPSSMRNFISQQGISLNEFHNAEIPEAQVTSCFGFVDPENLQYMRSGTFNQDKKSLMQKPFDDLKINYGFDVEAKTKNRQSTLNSTPFRKGKYQKYPQNYKIVDNKQSENCCSIELNCQNSNTKNNKTTSEQDIDESFNRFTFHNPKRLTGNRSNVLECTFALCQTDAQQAGHHQRKVLKSKSYLKQGRAQNLIKKKTVFANQTVDCIQKNDLTIRRQQGKSVQMRRTQIATQRNEHLKTSKVKRQSVQRIQWKNSCESRQLQKIRFPPISSRGH